MKGGKRKDERGDCYAEGSFQLWNILLLLWAFLTWGIFFTHFLFGSKHGTRAGGSGEYSSVTRPPLHGGIFFVSFSFLDFSWEFRSLKKC